MNAKKCAAVAALIFSLTVVCAGPGQTQAQDDKDKYPNMAPLDQYMMERDAEIALARTAAPEDISRDATGVTSRKGDLCTLALSSPRSVNSLQDNKQPNCKAKAPVAQDVCFQHAILLGVRFLPFLELTPSIQVSTSDRSEGTIGCFYRTSGPQ